MSRMNDNNQIIYEYITRLTGSPEVARIYQILTEKGPQTLSELARHTGIERTKLYRLIETITSSGIIEVIQKHKHTELAASSSLNLELLLNQKEAEMERLRNDLTVVKSLLSTEKPQSAATEVKYYEGAEGIKQILWNQTKAATECLSIIYEPINLVVGKTFMERWIEKMNENSVPSRLITTTKFWEINKAWREEHNLTDDLDVNIFRIVTDDVFKITHSIDIWDDVVVYYNWINEEIFAAEIYNAEIAQTQRQFFELLWNKLEQN